MDIIQKLILRYNKLQRNLSIQEKKQLFKLANNQNPEILLITCSDSRVEPYFLMGAKPGEVFVVRNAGNIITSPYEGHCGSLGSIEFAVEILKVKHIIICGHSDCGAVKAILNPKNLQRYEEIYKWLEVGSGDKDLNPKRSLLYNVQHHVMNQINKLKEVDFIAKKIKKNQVKLHAWYLDIPTYSLKAYCETTHQWGPINHTYLINNTAAVELDD